MATTRTEPTGQPAAPMYTLPTKQRVILELILQHHHLTGESYSARQLARRLSVHHSTIQEHFRTLYEKGWLTTSSGSAIPRVF